MRILSPCGTYGAYQRHLKAGEKPCDACREVVRLRSAQDRAMRAPTEWRGGTVHLRGVCSPDLRRLGGYIFKRDGGRCQIPDCAFADRRIRAASGPSGPSIDHIIPLSKWRPEDGLDANGLENLQLAHWRCNLLKAARVLLPAG